MTLTAEQARAVLERAELLHDAAAVDAALDRMAAAITEQLAERLPLVLCVMVGGLVPAGRLLPRLQFPLEVDYLHATRYGEQTRGGELAWLTEPRASMKDRTVLIIDDILDEGYTLDGVIEQCYKEGAREVQTAVLVSKLHERRYRNMTAQYVGLEVDDRYVFGAGMDYKGLMRNLPGIYAAAKADE